MKKWIALLLAVCMLAGFTACGAEPDTPAGNTGASETTADTSADAPSDTAAEPSAGAPAASESTPQNSSEPAPVEATQEELAELVADEFGEAPLLNALSNTLLRGNSQHISFRFNCKTDSPEECLFSDVRYPLYEYYFGEPEMVTFAENEDPFSAFDDNHTYAKYPIEQMNWLANNVLNLKDADPETLGTLNTYGEYKDGVFYNYHQGFVKSYGFEGRVTGTERLEDGTYRFTVAYQFIDYVTGPSNTDGTATLVAAIKEVDGRRIWSFYSCTGDLTVIYE